MGLQIYVLLCTKTTVSNPPFVFPKSSCDVHLLRRPWFEAHLFFHANDHISNFAYLPSTTKVKKNVDELRFILNAETVAYLNVYSGLKYILMENSCFHVV